MCWDINHLPEEQFMLVCIKILKPDHPLFSISKNKDEDLMPLMKVPWK